MSYLSNNFFNKILAYLLSLALFVCTSVNALPESIILPEKVTLTTHNLCPYGCYKNESLLEKSLQINFTGIAVNRVKCALEAMKTPLEILVLPWARAQKYVEFDHNADGFFAASQNDYRDKFAIMSAIIADQKWKWYLLADNPLNPTDKTFKQQARTGAFIGANMLKWLEKNNYNVVTKALNTEVLLEMLLKKRLDAILTNNHVTEALIEKHSVQDKIKSYVNLNKPLGVYFSKKFLLKYPTFLERFNKEILECRNIL